MCDILDQELRATRNINCISIAVASNLHSSRCSLLVKKPDGKNETFAFIVNEVLYQLVSLFSDDSTTEKEDKAIAAIKKEPIQVDQFLQRLRQKKLDKYLNFEVRVSSFHTFSKYQFSWSN